MVTKNVATVNLNGEASMKFDKEYNYFFVSNLSGNDVLISMESGIIADKDGVIIIPEGASAGTMHGYAANTIYLSGSGKVQVMGCYSAFNPFKKSMKGGEIKTTGGNNVTINNSAEFPLLSLTAYGRSTQDGTPTPESPAPIVSVGNDGAVEVTTCGKNRLKNTATTITNNGVTFTVNADGSVTANGTASDTAYIIISSNLKHLEVGKLYKMFGCPSGGGVNSYSIQVTGVWSADFGEGAIFKYQENVTTLAVYVVTGVTVSDVLFTPMICDYETIDNTFEPYQSTTATITTALPLRGIPVSGDGNYTDSSGQQWICDELIYNANGTGKAIKRIKYKELNGSENWSLNDTVDSTRKRLRLGLDELAIYGSNFYVHSPSLVICDEYKSVTNGNTAANIEGISVSHTAGYIAIYDENFATATIDEWKAHLAENPITVIYALNTPQETELTADEITALLKLRTYDGVTNVYNSEGADMSVKYLTSKSVSEAVMPIINRLENQEGNNA